MKVTAKLDNLRIAPRKTKLVADLIKGLDTKEALYQLDTRVKRTCPPMKKLLLSAIANGENNFGIDKDNMYVLDVVVGAGPTLKRWMPKAFGRAGQILKRTSQITIVLEEREEGKNRKSKEQLEKEKAARLKERQKAEKEARAKKEADEKEESSVDKPVSRETREMKKEESVRDSKNKSWGSRIFRRKSM